MKNKNKEPDDNYKTMVIGCTAIIAIAAILIAAFISMSIENSNKEILDSSKISKSELIYSTNINEGKQDEIRVKIIQVNKKRFIIVQDNNSVSVNDY